MVSSLPTQSEQPKRRSNDPISWYLQNIGRVPLLTPAEEIELGNQVQKMMILTEDGQLNEKANEFTTQQKSCLLYTSPSPRDLVISRMPSSA